MVPQNLFTGLSSYSAKDDDDETDHSDQNSDRDNDDRDIAENRFANTRGLKTECPLNVLDSFHCVDGFPPDILHDLFEGGVPEDLLGIIRILVNRGYFILDQYNIALGRLSFSSYESGNKPQLVPNSSKVKKLKSMAVSNWVHVRNWPILIRGLVEILIIMFLALL